MPHVPDRLTVIFDLDGTLVDTAEDVGALINPLLAERGLRQMTREDVVACFGLGARRFVDRALTRIGAELSHEALGDLTERFIARYNVALPVHSHALPGVPDALAACRAAGYRMGVCTNKPIAATRTLLDALGLSAWFDGVSGGDSLPTRKPDPLHLLDAIEKCGGARARAVMVGDSETDCACAIAAGVPVILIDGGYGHGSLDALGAQRVLPGFAGLMGALAELDPAR